MKNYWQISDFSNLYFEDSFVLNIVETQDQLIFEVDFVLTEKHPAYSKPRSGEQYCYRIGKFIFKAPTSVLWKSKSMRKSTDASGEVDYGNIDVFEETKPKTYELSGDWGHLIVVSQSIGIYWNGDSL